MILDSNIIIYYNVPKNSKLREYLKANKKNLVVSAISKLEVLGFNNLNSEEKKALEHLFQNLKILDINSSIIEKAIVLRQQKKMSIGDSIIAATALIYHHKLFTNNLDDFKHIPELEIIPLSSII